MADPAVTQTASPGLQTSADYSLKAVHLITSDAVDVDLSSYTVEINLYEDIFAPCVTGTLLLGDASDLVNNYKLHGNEWLIVQLDKPGLNQPIFKYFRVYKISEREFKTAALQNYVLHFCSEEMILSTQTYVSKAYNGMTITQMIKDILVNKLGVQSTKLAFFDETQGIFNIVIPRLHPFEAIQWLATRAFGPNKSLYLFYENRDGYNFQAYETLANAPVYRNFAYGVKLDNEPSNTHYSLNYLKIMKDFDIIETGQYGGYSSSLITYDFVSRAASGSKLDASQFELLNDNLQVNKALNRFNTPLTGADYLIKFYPMQDADSTQNPSQPYNWLHVKALRMAQINSYKMIATIPGDIMMKVGYVINLEIPLSQPKTDNSSSAEQVSQTRTGKYLVTAVHHTFINDIFTTVMELVSDSVVGQLNASQDTSPAMIAVKQK